MVLLLKLLASAVIGFISSRLLYRELHREEVPEMFRYGFGVLLVVLMAPLFVDKKAKQDELGGEVAKSALLAAVGVGAGVAANRILSD